MDQLIFITVFIVVGLAFIWFCRRMERNRRLEIYKQMLQYVDNGNIVGFCVMYKYIVGYDLVYDDSVHNEMFNEAMKLDTNIITDDTLTQVDFWFPIRDMKSRRIVLQNLINKLKNQKI